MADEKRITRRAALGLVAGGGFVLGAETFGFTNVTALRGTAVDVAGDSADALLGITETGDTPTNQENADVVEITNNADQEFDTLATTVNLDDPNGSLVISDPFAASLPQGDTTGLEMACDGGGDGTATVTVDAEAVGPSIRIHVPDFTHTFDYSCTGQAALGLTIEDVRGLEDNNPDHEYAAEVDVQENDNDQTQNFEVTLTITGDSGGVVYDQTRSPREIRNETITVSFDDIGQLPEDDYDYTVTADADNANGDTASGSFVVTTDALPPNLTVTQANTTGQQNSTIAFTVENTGETPAVVEALSIDGANHRNKTVDHVQRTGNEFQRTDGAGALDSLLQVPSSRTALDATATVGVQETATFELGAFRQSDGSTINMGNGSAEITLYLDGEPDQQLTLDP